MANKKTKVFTLLEIMVVIVILGLLASLTIPSLMSNKNRADQQKAVSDISALENALDMYRLDNGDYPTEQQGIAALVTKPNVPPLPQRYPSDGYIRRLPTDPWGNSYQMNNPGKHGQIDIFSIGPDRLPETEDDIGNWITLSISET